MAVSWRRIPAICDYTVPNPGNPQALNRYSYVLNNPLRYTDPTGMFTEDQLRSWFGENWRDLFDDAWEAILWMGEFGDAVVFGDITAVFVDQDGMLTGWNVNTRATQAITEITRNSGKSSPNLYRPWAANSQGGASAGDILTLGELTAPQLGASYQTNSLRWIYGNDDKHESLTLPLDWYRGPYGHVEVNDYFAGFELSTGDLAGLISIAGAAAGALYLGESILAGAGGPLGIAVLAVDIASWTTWDTSYRLAPGSGMAPPVPAPAPPLRR